MYVCIHACMYVCMYVCMYASIGYSDCGLLQYFIWLDTALNRPKFHLLLKETNDLKSVGLSKPPDSLPGSKTASPVQPGMIG